MFHPLRTSRRHALVGLASLATVSTLVAWGALALSQPAVAADPPTTATKPALTVTVTSPMRATLPVSLTATGNLTAWQEASIGAEAQGLRLAEVRVNVGDTVKRGQVLATFASDTLRADLAQLQAGLAEAEATAAAAAADAERARTLQASGALSAQQIAQYLTAEQTARARLEAQRAANQLARLRLAQTQVLAPDAGVISARAATVGAVVPGGMELFRLIRQGRLEWRAEVPAAEIAAIKPGQAVVLKPVGATGEVRGVVRMVAPTVDPATRNALVYVDLQTGSAAATGAKAGMFARGDFELGRSEVWTLPQSAVQLRDGQAQVLVVDAGQKVRVLKVATGRRQGDRIELLKPLPDGTRVVTAGGAFLADGDTVRVVEAPPLVPPASKASTAPASTTVSSQPAAAQSR